ncbi:hypothetical protein QIU18_07255 [Capnocytophaga canimorsus]|nr:hypothetical protein [Capnocytophaga canimorsus]WGU71530.1 hypothetical protein QIU18_07255 [Capnocytophaga canimorsus]
MVGKSFSLSLMLADLAVEILQKIGHRKITFFCGNLRRDTLPDFF